MSEHERNPSAPTPPIDDEATLRSMGYAQELARRMNAFSNFAISLSVICILAGGITSFHVGFCSAGGASIGIGWPLGCLFALCVALTMGQVASAFPTAGGLYHWASILGGRGWGWATAWFNLIGLVTVLAAINAGIYDFVVGAFGPPSGVNPTAARVVAVALLSLTQALCNHKGIRATTFLTDFSGYLILIVATLLTLALLSQSASFEPWRLVTFTNYSGIPTADPVFPRSDSMLWTFALGALLPAYTVTGFDASAHTSEETIGAAVNVPRSMVRAVLISGIFGWIMLCAIVLAIPNLDQAAQHGAGVFPWIMASVFRRPVATLFFVAIAIAQYICGLATLTSASRMTYAFARDGGLPLSALLRRVSPTSRTPSAAIWTTSIGALLFTVFVPYTTIAAVCAVFLYISYVLPTALGFFAYGRRWTRMGPWHIGAWFRPLTALSVIGGLFLLVIGVQPPNQQAIWIVGGMLGVMAIAWSGFVRARFAGPPQAILAQAHDASNR